MCVRRAPDPLLRLVQFERQKGRVEKLKSVPLNRFDPKSVCAMQPARLLTRGLSMLGQKSVFN